jgi:DNA helicase IV
VLEQERVDAAYAIADQLVEARSGPTQAATQKDAQAIHRGRQAKLEQLRQLLADDDRLLVRGRVDFASGAATAGEVAGETFYIGMAHLAALADQEPVVISWEAPLAKALREPTAFNGGGAVARTRVFEGRARQLSEVRETRFVNGQPEPGSGDPLLEALERRSGGQLHDVVATIQAEQFALMERPLDRTLVVQGGPGTGKTIIGLHRVSVLLFRSDGALTEGDVLVVGPNDVFMRYIERVLPELGRAAVTQTSINGLADHAVRAKGHDRPAAREIKGRAVMAEVIRRYLDARISWDHDADLVIDDSRVPKAEVERLLSAVRDSAAPYNRRREDLRGRLFDALGGARHGRPVPGNARGRGMQIASEAPEQFENALNRLMETRSSREVVHELTSGRILLQRASEGLLTPEEREAILVPTSRLRDRAWTVDDLPLLDEAAFQLDGTPALGKRYLHIVVDEAQDLSPMQLRMLRRRLSRTGAMTVLGDLAQGTSPWAPSRWEDHLGSADIEVDEVAQLRHSYRTTAPLLDYANRLLASIDVEIEPAASVLTVGDDPAVLRCVDAKELDQSLIEFVETVLPDEADSGSVAVIADDETLGRVSEAFDDAGIRHTWAARSLDMPVTLVPATSANGLEFDHVFVLEPEALYRTDAVMGPRLLYVALTRARETVTLLHLDRLPTVLTGASAPSAPAAPAEPPAADVARASVTPTPVVAGASSSAREPEPVGWSWFTPSPDGDGLLHVTLSGTTARIERVPSTGGEGIPIATGHALSDEKAMHWLLQRDDGSVLTLTTGREAGSASNAVVTALSDGADVDG